MLGLVARDWWVFAIRASPRSCSASSHSSGRRRRSRCSSSSSAPTSSSTASRCSSHSLAGRRHRAASRLGRGHHRRPRHRRRRRHLRVAGPDGPVAALRRGLLGDRDGHVPGHRGRRPPARARQRDLDGARRGGLGRLRRAARRLPRRGAHLARVARRALVGRLRGLEPGLAYRLHKIDAALRPRRIPRRRTDLQRDHRPRGLRVEGRPPGHTRER